MSEFVARLVLAEDEETIRRNLARLLRLEGYEVFDAPDGQAALELIRQQQPDLVLSDVMMPVLDGYGLLEKLRADPATHGIPLIFLTARADRGDVRDGMHRGADDYITKPVEREDLLRTLRARLDRTRAQREAVQRLQQEAKHLLHFDTLTRLPNRSLLDVRLSAAKAHAERYGSNVALLLVGLDGFGRINDAFGREAGDRILRETARRLERCLAAAPVPGPFDTVARLAGGEFALLVEGFGPASALEPFSASLAHVLAEPFSEAGKEIFLSASQGIAVQESVPDGPGLSLPEQAEAALRKSKAEGPGSRVFYSGEISKTVSRRLMVENALHAALAAGQLSLHYQPQIEIATGALAGCEALMRWNHPELGFVSPAEFIPVAEQSGLIVDMGTWALNTATRQAKQWLDAGCPVRVAVNLSARQVVHEGVLSVVAEALQASGLPPHLLELEITESVAMHDVEMVIVTLASLKALGVALAMDDFGTGYSSLAYLKRLPLDVLKVDQSFVRNVTSDKGDAAITRAVVAMAHSFEMAVVAEGVETQEHLDHLAGLGCEIAQGYLFSRPLPFKAATDWFMARRQIAQE